MARIEIDGKTCEVNPNNNLLQECLSQGIDLPYFCWHPCMGSVGACRQCAVKVFKDKDDTRGTLVMACMTQAAEGTLVSVDDKQAADFRAGVIESLMISHPHDCPVCEEGGECHLQDMTLMSGHNYRRHDKKKVTFRNQYLGPHIGHEMNRCIACYRCVRYYDDYAGGNDLVVQASHNHVYFGRHQEGVLESEFSGNLVEVCPTGVFTDKTFSKHYTRKWDLQTAPSVCNHCAVGCNTTPGERYGTLRRVVNRYHAEINGYFICDRGRFAYDLVNGDRRVASSHEKGTDGNQELTGDQGSVKLRDLARGNTLAIGSPRAGMEANFALMRLVGRENFYSGISDKEAALLNTVLDVYDDSGIHCPSIHEIEAADAIIILGEDVTNIAPRIALALRQSVRNRSLEMAADSKIPSWQDAAVRELAQREKSPLYILNGYATRLDDIAAACHIDHPDRLAEFAAALAGAVDPAAPAPSVMMTAEQQQLLECIASDLIAAKRPLVIAGVSNEHEALLGAATNLARALGKKRNSESAGPVNMCCLVPEANSLGLAMLLRGSVNTLSAACERMKQGGNAIVLENDLYRRMTPVQVDESLSALETLVAIDHVHTPTVSRANIVLASTAFSEQQAVYVNYEGRAQISYQVHESQFHARPAWRWAAPGMKPDALIRECAANVAGLEKLVQVLPDTTGLVSGMKIPRQPPRYSGRTAMNASRYVHEPKQATDDSSPLNFSMEGIPLQKDSRFQQFTWAPRWNSNQSISKFQDEIAGELKQGQPGVNLLSGGGSFAYAVLPEQSGLDAAESDAAFQVIQAFHIFGSEELSAMSENIQARMPGPYAAMAPVDAARLEIGFGDFVDLRSGSVAVQLPVSLREKIKPGTVVVYGAGNEINRYELAATAQLSLGERQSNGGHLDALIVSDARVAGTGRTNRP
ncbi:MAG: NADH-quinone oxidoreductase subunit NuoG [Pseudohongiellaceae bacterium]